jgi:hypothetical protein
MAKDLRAELQALVEVHLDALAHDLEKLVHARALELVSETLGGYRGPTARAARTVPAIRGRARGTRASAASVATAASKILSYVGSHPGKRAEVVRAGVGIGKPLWTRAIARLVKDGQIKKSGQRRATTLRRA